MNEKLFRKIVDNTLDAFQHHQLGTKDELDYDLGIFETTHDDNRKSMGFRLYIKNTQHEPSSKKILYQKFMDITKGMSEDKILEFYLYELLKAGIVKLIEASIDYERLRDRL